MLPFGGVKCRAFGLKQLKDVLRKGTQRDSFLGVGMVAEKPRPRL